MEAKFPTVPGNAGFTPEMANDMVQAGDAARISGVNYLKFTKHATWVFGIDNDELDSAEVAMVNPASFTAGWQGWNGGKPVTGPVVPYAQRGSLPMETELDKIPAGDMNGWQPQLGVTLQLSDGTPLQFNSTSDGGKKAILALMREVGLAFNGHPEAYIAMVTFGSDSYKHPSYGTINKPQFNVVGWAGEDGKEVKKLAA